MAFFKKLLGWVLFFLGLIIIFYSLYSSYNIFLGNDSAPEIFTIQEQREKETVNGVSPGMEEIIQRQLKGMIPEGSATDLLNLISWSIFAGVLIFGGAKISGLGIRLII